MVAHLNYTDTVRTVKRTFIVVNIPRITYRKLSVLHDELVLLNKPQQIWGGVCIHCHYLSSTDTVLLLQFFRVCRKIEQLQCL